MTPIISEMRKATKAIYAGVSQLIASLILVTVDGTGFGSITTNQWLVIVLAVFGVAGGVYGFSNKAA